MSLLAALVGTGWWGKELAKAAQGILVLDGFFSREMDDCEALCKKYGGRPYVSYEEILEDESIGAVILATPHSLHSAQIVAAAHAGKHVFVEKPLALTVEAASRAVEACRERARVLAVGHNRRFSAAARRMKSLIDGGDCGQIIHVEANYSGDTAMRLPAGHWRLQRDEMPGAGIAPMGLHMIDTLQWLLGPVDRLASLCKRQAIGADIDDTSVTLFELSNGIPGTLASNLACPLTADLRVYGTRMNLEARRNFSELSVGGAVEQFGPDDTLERELHAFERSCTGDAPYPVDPLEAVRNVAVMEAIARSRGAWISL